jgi:hypothetical protein
VDSLERLQTVGKLYRGGRDDLQTAGRPGIDKDQGRSTPGSGTPWNNNIVIEEEIKTVIVNYQVLIMMVGDCASAGLCDPALGRRKMARVPVVLRSNEDAKPLSPRRVGIMISGQSVLYVGMKDCVDEGVVGAANI